MIHVLHSTFLFHTLAALTLFGIAAVQACLPAAQRPRRILITNAPPLASLIKPDAQNQDFTESYDEAA